MANIKIAAIADTTQISNTVKVSSTAILNYKMVPLLLR